MSRVNPRSEVLGQHVAAVSASIRDEAEAAERAAARRAGEVERLRSDAEARILDWSRQVRRGGACSIGVRGKMPR